MPTTKNSILIFIKENKQLLKDKYKVNKIGLFGSFAKDEVFHPKSQDNFFQNLIPFKNHNLKLQFQLNFYNHCCLLSNYQSKHS
jgi:hypothetical protein